MNKILFSGKSSCEDVRKILGRSYIKKNSDIVCVAKMIYEGEEYWAVNGVKRDELNNINALKSIVKSLDNDHICRTYRKAPKKETCYYHHEQNGTSYVWHIISYSDYQSTIKKTKGIDENYRLFSCCERKLISRLDNEKDSFKMYVAFPPCYMCENAFLYLYDRGNINFEVHYTDTPDDLETQCVKHLSDLRLI